MAQPAAFISNTYQYNQLPKFSSPNKQGLIDEYFYSANLTKLQRFKRLILIVATVVGSIFCLGIPFAFPKVCFQLNIWWNEFKAGKKINLERGCRISSLASGLKDSFRNWPGEALAVAGCFRVTVGERQIHQKMIFRNVDGKSWSDDDLSKAVDFMAIQCLNNALGRSSANPDTKIKYVFIHYAPDGYRAYSGQKTCRKGGVSSSSSLVTSILKNALAEIGFDSETVLAPEGGFI